MIIQAVQKHTLLTIKHNKGNVGSLLQLRKANKNSNIHILPIVGASHFNIFAPANKVIAQHIASHRKGKFKLVAQDIQKKFSSFMRPLPKC